MWLPPFKYIKGLFASSEDSGISNSDGSSYTGPYFKVSSGNIYSGEIPSKDSRLLIDNFSKKANQDKLGAKGLNYERTKSRYKTIIRSWCALGTQDFKMESENEEIYFWRKKFNSYNRFNANSRFY